MHDGDVRFDAFGNLNILIRHMKYIYSPWLRRSLFTHALRGVLDFAGSFAPQSECR
jgi:hypothetical protein